MAYIGKSPSTGIRNRFIYTATAGQATFSGTDDHNRTLSYTDAEFTDVFLNGVKLDKSDYTATSGTSIVLDEAAAVGDTLEVLNFDTFSVFSGEFSQDVTVGGATTLSGDLTVDTDTLYVDSTNNRVGIGTTSPVSKLHIENGDIRIEKDTKATIGFRGHTSGSTALAFRDSNAAIDRMTIHSNGHVAIGSTADEGILYVASSENNNIGEHRSSNSSYTSQMLRQRCNRGGSSSYYFLLASSGNTADNEAFIRGDGRIAGDAGFQTGADYAEFFEWDDGNSSDEDRRGYSVVLMSGNKIRKATSSDAAADIIGVISGHPSVVGDAAWSSWGGKFNRDDFGGYIWETYTVTEWTEAVEDGDDIEHSYQTDQIPSDVTVPADATVITQDDDGNTLKRKQVNSSYDDTQSYTPREDRQEWDAVGMVGKLRLRVGQPTGDRWIKMRDIATDDDGNITIEEWLVR